MQLNGAGVELVARAQQLTGRFRTGLMTQDQYVSEINSLRNPPVGLPSVTADR
jgi:hypothetical protein